MAADRAKFELVEAKPDPDSTTQYDPQTFWHLQSRNGDIVFQGEGHRDAADAQRAIHGAITTTLQAVVDDPGIRAIVGSEDPGEVLRAVYQNPELLKAMRLEDPADLES